MQRYFLVILLALYIVFMFVPSVPAEPVVNIIILSGDQLKSTARTISGAKKVINRRHQTVTYHQFLVTQTVVDEISTVDSIRQLNPKLILTVGSEATRLAKENFSDIPIVFAAVMYPRISGFVNSFNSPGENITGASLNIPIDVQFRYYKTILPDLKKIGVLYTDHTEMLIAPAKIVAQQMGLTLVPLKIGEAKQLPHAIDSLARTVDGLWSLADPELFTPQSTRFILLNTLRKNLPLMGFSRHVVESGALFALDFNYKGIGQQAGDIAVRVLDGQSAGSIPVSQADALWFHYNARTAKHLKIKIPEELAAVAKEVYR